MDNECGGDFQTADDLANLACEPNLPADCGLPGPAKAGHYRVLISCSDYAGTCRSGIGFAMNNLRHGLARSLAMRSDFAWRALSVAMPVLAYI